MWIQGLKIERVRRVFVEVCIFLHSDGFFCEIGQLLKIGALQLF